MSHTESSSADPEAASVETNDKAIEPAVRSESPDHTGPDHNPALELPSSPHQSPPSQHLSSPQSAPLALRYSPHLSPPPQLGNQSPPLALRSSPYRSPSPPPPHRRSSSSNESPSPRYSPTLHQSLSPSPPSSPPPPPPPRRNQSPPQQIPRETHASVEPFAATAAPGNGEERAPAYDIPEPLDKPLPTTVDAYKHRGIRSTSSKLNALSIANVAVRAFAAVFTLISFSVIASNKDTLLFDSGFGAAKITLNFDDLFYLSYLLTANVISFVYVVTTMIMFMYYMNNGKPVENLELKVVVFALDQILSYLLMSASSSAATGIRAQSAIINNSALDNFESQAYAGVAMSFVAFFLLAAASLISGFSVVYRKRF